MTKEHLIECDKCGKKGKLRLVHEAIILPCGWRVFRNVLLCEKCLSKLDNLTEDFLK